MRFITPSFATILGTLLIGAPAFAGSSVSFPIKGSDGAVYTAQTIPTDSNGNVPVSAPNGLPLPAGAATAAAQATIITHLPIDSNGNLRQSLYDATGAPVTYGGTTTVIQPDVRATGTIAAATLNATYAVALANGQGVVGFAISGLTGSGATLVPEVSNDGGTTWSAVNAVGPSGISQALTANQQVRVNAGGHTNVRLRVSVVGTGTIAVASNVSLADSLVIDPNNAPFGGETPVTVGGTPAYVGRSLKAICTTAGTITYTYIDGSTGSWGLSVGTQTLPIALASLTSVGAASCSYANLR